MFVQDKYNYHYQYSYHAINIVIIIMDLSADQGLELAHQTRGAYRDSLAQLDGLGAINLFGTQPQLSWMVMNGNND